MNAPAKTVTDSSTHRFHESATAQVQGRASYIDDLPLVEGTHVLAAATVFGTILIVDLRLLGLRVVVVRNSAMPADEGIETVAYETIRSVLPQADWLLLACPLTDRTHGLISASALALLPAGAHVVNVARGEVVDEAALIEALQNDRLGGAYLDVFAHEPLPVQSPLWDMTNVIASPHSAGFSDGNAARVEELFLDNLGRRLQGLPMRNLVG